MTNQNAIEFRQAKTIHYFYFLHHLILKQMFVHSARTHGAMLELKNRQKIQDLLDFNQKMGKTVAAKLVLTFLPYRL